MQQREVENLTKAQLDEFKTKFLTTTNPQAAHNITVYQYKDHSFKKDDIQDHLMIHFSMDGNILLHDSEEAKDMEDMRDMKGIEVYIHTYIYIYIYIYIYCFRMRN